MNATWREDNNIYFSTANRTGNGEHAEAENSEEWEGGRPSDEFENRRLGGSWTYRN